MGKLYDFAIIGGGVSGFAGAMYAGRLGLKAIIFSETTGGTIILTDKVENYPGIKSTTGKGLADAMKEHALEYPIELVEERVERVERCEKTFKLYYKKDKHIEAKTVLFATGTKWRKLGVPGEEEYKNRGVHYCALCDGYFYRGKKIAVVGGGDSACKEALQLTEFGDVTMLVRNKLKAEPVNLKRFEAKKNARVVLGVVVKEILGDGKKVTGVTVVDKQGNEKKMGFDAVFVEIGHIPLSELAVAIGVNVDAHNEIVINRNAETNVPGVYAAGDVCDTRFKQAITGVAEAVTASYSAFQYVGENEILPCGEGNGNKPAFEGKPPITHPEKLGK